MRRRRTFAIISHPDAGKTTLTEKLLLFSGAIQITGSVKPRKAARHASSDWVEIEKLRGISEASSVMPMEFRDCLFNLLDTPGHQDFSEDTYRVLTAVDAVHGVEPLTRRQRQVCREGAINPIGCRFSVQALHSKWVGECQPKGGARNAGIGSTRQG